jgi:hypothetical protein
VVSGVWGREDRHAVCVVYGTMCGARGGWQCGAISVCHQCVPSVCGTVLLQYLPTCRCCATSSLLFRSMVIMVGMVLYGTVSYCIVLYRTVSYCIVLYCTALYCLQTFQPNKE